MSTNEMKIPELLAPAGTFEKMEYAFAYGADAVYAGVPKFSLRVRENDFDEQRLSEAIKFAHNLGKKIYLTMNIFPHNRKVDAFVDMLAKVAEMKPDGLIMADPGMIMQAREKHPELIIHLSTQANTINWQSVKFWKDIGVKRIILSREINLDEIKEIKQHVPDIELESFVHGAICIPGVACYPIILRIVMPIRALVPTPVAGNINYMVKIIHKIKNTTLKNLNDPVQ